MKEIIVNNNTYLFIEVPNDFLPRRFPLDPRNNVIWGKSNNTDYTVVLKEKDFSISYEESEQPIVISTTKDITEEQVISLIPIYSELHKDLYVNYLNNFYIESQFKTAKESLQSLIQANGLDVNKNYLILKNHEI